mmetsp:Transcript_58491/g.143065  ORF Transcript_58491/g.143065 Transcript_58491/m.143065 type:complete len:84 (-) Transcript_58491:1897-2148(-)
MTSFVWLCVCVLGLHNQTINSNNNSKQKKQFQKEPTQTTNLAKLSNRTNIASIENNKDQKQEEIISTIHIDSRKTKNNHHVDP